MIGNYPPKLSPAEQRAWRPALKAAYKTRGVSGRPGRPFDDFDLWNVACFRAARKLFPDETK